MKGIRFGLALAIVLALEAAALVLPARADDGFLTSLSKVATREACKQLRDKQIKFAAGPLDGHVQAIEPDRYLTAQVHEFTLANDLLRSTVTASGRVSHRRQDQSPWPTSAPYATSHSRLPPRSCLRRKARSFLSSRRFKT